MLYVTIQEFYNIYFLLCQLSLLFPVLVSTPFADSLLVSNESSFVLILHVMLLTLSQPGCVAEKKKI